DDEESTSSTMVRPSEPPASMGMKSDSPSSGLIPLMTPPLSPISRRSCPASHARAAGLAKSRGLPFPVHQDPNSGGPPRRGPTRYQATAATPQPAARPRGRPPTAQ